MEKKQMIITIVVVVVIILVAVGWYLYRSLNTVDPETGERPGVGGLFPIAGDSDTPPPDDPDRGSSGRPASGEGFVSPAGKLRELTVEPIAGAVFVPPASDDASAETEIRYLTRGEGHVRSVSADGSEEKILVNDTVTRIHKAVWSQAGTALVLQRLTRDRDVETQYLSFSVPAEGGSSDPVTDLERVSLAGPIGAYAISPDGERVVVLVEGESGSQLVTHSPQSGGRSVIQNTPLRDLVLDWPAPATLTLTTKAATGLKGSMYSLAPSGGSFRHLLSNVEGLTGLMSPGGSYILYSDSGRGSPQITIRNRQTGVDTETRVIALPEKCVWENDTILYCAIPMDRFTFTFEEWYQGRTFFADVIWRFDVASGEKAEKIVDLRNIDSETGEKIVDLSDINGRSIDAINLEVSPDGRYLMFTDKKDGHLWSYRLSDNAEQ